MFLIFWSETETATFIPGCNEYHIKRDGHKQDFCHEEIRLKFTLLMLLPVLQSLKCCSDEEQTAWSEGYKLYHHRPPRIQIFLMWPCSAFFTGHTCYQVSVGVADVHTAAPPTICLTSFLMGDVVPSPEQTHSRNAHMRYMGRAVPAMQNLKKDMYHLFAQWKCYVHNARRTQNVRGDCISARRFLETISLHI